MWRLPVQLLMWVLAIAITIPVALLGLVVVPLMYPLRSTSYKYLPWWTRLWANLEDWEGQPNNSVESLPLWYYNKYGGGFKSFYKYHATRNSADGLRSFAWFALAADEDKIGYRTKQYFRQYTPAVARDNNIKTFGYICWQGFKMGVKLVHIWNDKRHLVIKFGWRIRPIDKVEPVNIFASNFTAERNKFLKAHLSFTMKFLVYREG